MGSSHPKVGHSTSQDVSHHDPDVRRADGNARDIFIENGRKVLK